MPPVIEENNMGKTIEELKEIRSEAERTLGTCMGHGRAAQAQATINQCNWEIRELESGKPRAMEVKEITAYQCDLTDKRDEDGNLYPSCKGFALRDPHDEKSGCDYYVRYHDYKPGFCSHPKAGKESD